MTWLKFVTSLIVMVFFGKIVEKKSFSDHTHIKLSKIIDPKIRHCLIQGAKSRLVCKRIIDLTHF